MDGQYMFYPVKLSYWDAVISLGGSCQVAEQLNRFHLRDASYPFDWLFSEEAEYVIQALENRFDGFLAAENLTESPTVTGHRKITDNRYHMVHQHIFPLEVPWQQSYATVKETVDRRVRRFLSWGLADVEPQDTGSAKTEIADREPSHTKEGKKILFIRTNLTMEQSERLSALLSKQFGEKAFLLVINHTRNFQLKSILLKPNLQIYEIYDGNEFKNDDFWNGYAPHWNQLLFGVRLKELKPMADDSLFRNFHVCERDEYARPFRWTKKRSSLNLDAYGGRHCTLAWKTVIPVTVNLMNAAGITIFFRKMEEGESAVFTFPITHENRRIVILLSGTWRPSELFHTDDERELGICLHSIDFQVPETEM